MQDRLLEDMRLSQQADGELPQSQESADSVRLSRQFCDAAGRSLRKGRYKSATQLGDHRHICGFCQQVRREECQVSLRCFHREAATGNPQAARAICSGGCLRPATGKAQRGVFRTLSRLNRTWLEQLSQEEQFRILKERVAFLHDHCDVKSTLMDI